VDFMVRTFLGLCVDICCAYIKFYEFLGYFLNFFM
jgi:hypothetical protein